MLRRGVLTSEDTMFKFPVYLSGRAHSFIRIKEVNSTAVDSMNVKEFDFSF